MMKRRYMYVILLTEQNISLYCGLNLLCYLIVISFKGIPAKKKVIDYTLIK